MFEAEIVQGRKISRVEIAEIAGLIEANPHWSRWRLSQVLAQRWHWYSASGTLKDMAARTLLLKLHQRELIALPERRRAPPQRSMVRHPELFEAVVPEPIQCDLARLLPLEIQVVDRKQGDYYRFERYLAQYHYLSYRGPVGENLGYLIRSGTGADLACLLFGAAAWQCAGRDQWIGWSVEQRAQGLPFLANNSRFLILPWVQVRQLASAILGQIVRRIDADWQQRYHHHLYLLETFVQPDRFQGTCYQAANWIRVGQTTGRTRQSQRQRDNLVHAPRKDIYLCPLVRHVLQTLSR